MIATIAIRLECRTEVSGNASVLMPTTRGMCGMISPRVSTAVAARLSETGLVGSLPPNALVDLFSVPKEIAFSRPGRHGLND
jgi:hypothetical protein